MYGSSRNLKEKPLTDFVLFGLIYKTKNVSAWTETFLEPKNRDYFFYKLIRTPMLWVPLNILVTR